MLRATVFLAPLILIGALASPAWAGGVWLCGGLLMIILAARGRSWTEWAAAPDWPGMTYDPLFKRINAALSALWGGIFAVSGMALLVGGGPTWRWVLMPLGVLIAAVLPHWWSDRSLQQRLRDADPNAWPSPLHGTATVDVDIDVAVVGAGIGGLTAAALLAQAGQRVAVFEQHDKPGGFCHCWEGIGTDGGNLVPFRFDAGVHDISGWFEGGTVREILRRLNLEAALEWRRMDHSFVDGGQRWDAPRGWDAFTESLAARHPTMAPALRLLLADVRIIFDAMYATSKQRGGVPGQPDSVEGLKVFAREHPLAVRWMQLPFGDLLAHHGVSGSARQQLLALSVYVTHDAATLRVRDMVPLFGYFLHGGHYLRIPMNSATDSYPNPPPVPIGLRHPHSMNTTVRLGRLVFRAEEASPSPVSLSLIRARPTNQRQQCVTQRAVAWRFPMARPGHFRSFERSGNRHASDRFQSTAAIDQRLPGTYSGTSQHDQHRVGFVHSIGVIKLKQARHRDRPIDLIVSASLAMPVSWHEPLTTTQSTE